MRESLRVLLYLIMLFTKRLKDKFSHFISFKNIVKKRDQLLKGWGKYLEYTHGFLFFFLFFS